MRFEEKCELQHSVQFQQANKPHSTRKANHACPFLILLLIFLLFPGIVENTNFKDALKTITHHHVTRNKGKISDFINASDRTQGFKHARQVLFQ